MVTPEVTSAQHLAAQLILWEITGPGDLDNAMRRLSRRYGIEYSALWSLRYRSPKRIWADVANAISAAYEAERQRQIRKLQHATFITEAVAGSDCASVAAAKAVLGQAASAASALVEPQRQRLNEAGLA